MDILLGTNGATVKPLSDFPRTRGSPSRFQSYCTPCHNARGRATLEKVGGARTYHVKRRYGMSAEDADRMLAEQDGLCAVCAQRPAEYVDHDHTTGSVRGLLCFNCNGGLGQFRDDADLLDLAIDYLDSHRRPSDPSTTSGARAPQIAARVGSARERTGARD